MKDFRSNGGGGSGFGGGNRGDSRGGFKGGFKGNSFGKRDFNGPKQMFQATCAACGKPCEVPFRPNGEKPVYCRDCFGENKMQGQGQGQSSDFPRNSFPKREFNAPPVFRPDPNARQIEEIKKQLDVVNSKLDRLLQKIEGSAKAAPAEQTKESLSEMVTSVQKTEKKAKKGASKKK